MTNRRRRSEFLVPLLLVVFIGCKAVPMEQAAKDRYTEAKRLYAASDYARAAEIFSEAIELQPRSPESFLMRANCYLHQIGQSQVSSGISLAERALPDYTRAIALDPALYEAIYNRSMVFAYLGRYLEAGKDLNICLEARDIRIRRQAHKMLGVLYEDKFESRIADAKRHFEQHLTLGGDDPDVRDRLRRMRSQAMGGQTLEQRQAKLKKQVEDAQKAFAAGNLDEAAVKVKVLIQFYGGEAKASAELLELSSTIKAARDRERKAEALVGLAEDYLRENNRAKAMELLRETMVRYSDTQAASRAATKLIQIAGNSPPKK